MQQQADPNTPGIPVHQNLHYPFPAQKMSEYDMPWEDGKKALSELLAAVVDLDTERIVLLAEKLSDFLKK